MKLNLSKQTAGLLRRLDQLALEAAAPYKARASVVLTTVTLQAGLDVSDLSALHLDGDEPWIEVKVPEEAPETPTAD